MDVRFIPPEIRSLELLTQELLLLPLFVEDRPPGGALELVDYRLAGAVSKLMMEGRIGASLGSAYALGGRPKLGFERVVIVGAGSIATFNRAAAEQTVRRMLEAASELKARRATVELPGRARDLSSPEERIETLLEVARSFGPFDTWTLIETPAAAKKMALLAEGKADRRWGVPGSTTRTP
jgi:hypothetical protein